MAQTKALSVVIPHYNHGAQLAAALAALVRQDAPPDEIIVVDDGSDDANRRQIESIVARMPLARIVYQGTNQGVNRAISRGVSEAVGEFFFVASADDEVCDGIFREALGLLRRYPTAALCSGLCLTVDAVGGVDIMRTPLVCDAPCHVSRERVAALLLRDQSWIVSGTTVYRRALWLEAGGLREELSSFADGFQVNVLALRHGVCFAPYPLLKWRLAEQGMAGSDNARADRTRQIEETAARLIASQYGDLFPSGYIERWRARWWFGAFNYRLARRLRRSPLLRRIPGVAAAIRLAIVGPLFLLTRPRDIVPAARRRLSGRYRTILLDYRHSRRH